jgi:hypothetical protein
MLTISSILKYVTEGLSVALASYIVGKKNNSPIEVLLIGLMAGLTFMILDMFTDGVGASARQGAGFGIGLTQVGFGGGGGENMIGGGDLVDQKSEQPYHFSSVDLSTCPQKVVGVSSGSGSGVSSQSTGKVSLKSRPDVHDPQNTNNIQDKQGYKIIPGHYSKYVLQPGYSEGVRPENTLASTKLANF